MEIPDYQPFYIDSHGALRAEISRLGLALPTDEELTCLSAPLVIGSRAVANRFCIQPMAGNDAQEDGSPSEFTCRRYRRYASGGAGLIWIESTTAGNAAATPARRLALHEGSLATFTSMVAELREIAWQRWQHQLVIILQLTNPLPAAARVHRLPDAAEAELITDAEIDACRDDLLEAGVLAASAGFDGVDVQACRGALAGLLLGAFTRSGTYGGKFEDRTRFLRETLGGLRRQNPGLILATRLSAYDAIQAPFGFGVDASDYRKPDLDEPRRLVQQLRGFGLDLLNSTAASPDLAGPMPQRTRHARADSEPTDEHPLTVLDRQLRIASALREAAPGLTVVGSGFAWLRQFVPHVASAAIRDGAIDLVGLGRSALAYPDAPAALLRDAEMDAGSSCLLCFACDQLLADGAKVGCPIRDRDHYATEYRHVRHFAADRLGVEAARCHLCEAAPCTAASPTATDIPVFIRAFREGDESRAYEIIRRTDVLPEMTAQLTPGWLHSEAACIESALSGHPIRILDLQYAISWQARQRGATGVRLPRKQSGKSVAIVGGGPAGIAAAARLLESGHEVDLFESSAALGGIPGRIIPASRFHGAAAEIGALLGPAIQAAKLRVHLNTGLGHGLDLPTLRASCSAVLLATGLWQEQALDEAEPGGVIDALTFLQDIKRGTTGGVPPRVAVLAGGDSAMDAAKSALELGAADLFIVFGGPRSAMHWHLPEGWFATPGVHAMMRCRPLGYATGAGGAVEGLRLHQAEFDREVVLRIDLIIRAMGLESADPLRQALACLAWSDDARLLQVDDRFRTSAAGVFAAGALVNGGASVSRCVAEGLAAAAQIHLQLSGTE